jgi:hypothetical protein
MECLPVSVVDYAIPYKYHNYLISQFFQQRPVGAHLAFTDLKKRRDTDPVEIIGRVAGNLPGNIRPHIIKI